MDKPHVVVMGRDARGNVMVFVLAHVPEGEALDGAAAACRERGISYLYAARSASRVVASAPGSWSGPVVVPGATGATGATMDTL